MFLSTRSPLLSSFTTAWSQGTVTYISSNLSYALHTDWYTTEAGTIHTGWYYTHRLVLYTQAGTPHTGWYYTHRLVLYTQAGTLHTGWYSTHRLVCTYVCIYTNLFPRDLVISHLMHQINVHLLSAQ